MLMLFSVERKKRFDCLHRQRRSFSAERTVTTLDSIAVSIKIHYSNHLVIGNSSFIELDSKGSIAGRTVDSDSLKQNPTSNYLHFPYTETLSLLTSANGLFPG